MRGAFGGAGKAGTTRQDLVIGDCQAKLGLELERPIWSQVGDEVLFLFTWTSGLMNNNYD